METLQGIMVEATNKAINPILIPLNEAFQRQSVRLRLWIHWYSILRLLEHVHPKKCKVDFSIGRFISSMFCNLRNTNRLILKFIEGHYQDVGNMSLDQVILLFAWQQTRAAMCQRLLYSLQSEIRKKLRSKRKNHSPFFAFLILVFKEVRQLASLDEQDVLVRVSNKV
jgi:hypothetical protein